MKTKQTQLYSQLFWALTLLLGLQPFLGLSFDQEPLVPGAPSFLNSPSKNILSALIYFGEETHSNACFHSLDEKGDYDEGILFTDFNMKNYCLRINEETEEVYFNGVFSDQSEVKLIDLGEYISSFRVIYDFELEMLYVSKGEKGDSTTHYKAKTTNRISALFISAILSAEDDYQEIIGSDEPFEVFPFETTWKSKADGNSLVEVEIQKGDTECFTADFGMLNGIEICAFFDNKGHVEVSGDSTAVFTSREAYDYKALIVTLSSFDNLIKFYGGSSETKESSLFFITPLQINYLLDEGDIDTGLSGTMTLRIDNRFEPLYDCLTFKTSVMVFSALYPSIEAICIECESGKCQMGFLVEAKKNEPIYTSFSIASDSSVTEESIEIVYYADQDEFTIRFETYSWELRDGDLFYFRRFADEILIWAESLNEDLQYGSIIGDLSEEYTVVDSFLKIKGRFNTMNTIQYQTFDQDYGVYCETDRCWLGYYSDGFMEAVKEYHGAFDAIYTFKITDLGVNQYCLTLKNNDLETCVNDCNTEEQWLLYQEYVSQFPIYSGEVEEYFSDSA